MKHVIVFNQIDTTYHGGMNYENEQLFNFSENDEESGNENIYLSGGQGIITKLDLFSGVTENENGEEVNEFEY